jgi:hypothetical protein
MTQLIVRRFIQGLGLGAECGHARLSLPILFRKVHEYANSTSVTLLRARCKRPRRCPAN